MKKFSGNNYEEYLTKLKEAYKETTTEDAKFALKEEIKRIKKIIKNRENGDYN